MSQVLLWQDDILVNLECDESLISHGISCICYVEPFVCVTSKQDGALHIGPIVNSEEQLHVTLTPSNINATDLACSSDKRLLYVTVDGRVFLVSPSNLESKEEIVLEEDASCCVHGHSTPRKCCKVKSVKASNDGIFFVTQNGHLWALGNHPHLNIKSSDGVKRVNYFQGRHVVAVDCGSNFCVALVQRKLSSSLPDLNVSNNQSDDNEDVFVHDCPKCISESSTSLLSHHSTSDTCPLGLPVCKSSLDHSTSSTTSKGNNEKISIDGTTSPSTEDELVPRCRTCTPTSDNSDDISSPKTTLEGKKPSANKDEETNEKRADSDEGERKNSMFLNTEVARQFLTRQLSWVSSYGNAGEEFLAEYTEGTTRIVR